MVEGTEVNLQSELHSYNLSSLHADAPRPLTSAQSGVPHLYGPQEHGLASPLIIQQPAEQESEYRSIRQRPQNHS